jgi:hypothetical protein
MSVAAELGRKSPVATDVVVAGAGQDDGGTTTINYSDKGTARIRDIRLVE